MKIDKENLIELWKDWKKDPKEHKLNKLIDNLRPVIYKELSRWSRGIGYELLYPSAISLTVKALKSYNPKVDTSLTTHLVNQLKPLSRVAYTYQDPIRIPEYKLLKSMTAINEIKKMMDELNREPTVEEVADRLKISKSKANYFLKIMHVKTPILESTDYSIADIDKDSKKSAYIDFFYHSLTPIQQKVFEYTVGYKGAPRLRVEDIASKLNISPQQVYKIRYQIMNAAKSIEHKV